MNTISVPSQLSFITKPYTQTRLATINSTHDIKIALLEGPYIFHSHPDNDEAFYLVSGSLTIEILDHEEKVEEVKMQAGDLFVVPKGVRHRPIGKEARVMVIEKKGVLDGSGGLAQPIEDGK
ncbi:uncharacterized protein LY89DRAFT_686338 [Mollisia scopiformis]|uniref:Cupin type-2 domain-containing protein n=1 Tax=Mollisia scopiformis TaxID=149040 RepID=A0A194X3N7_MOLSC|nr:uncharacterized protein LY89DRAFT_686338 [Mollisia scopiformis]KUJ14649.1 hypothetical protein LY89DRAFT_686338 [Mollisia scopiformis]